MPKEFHRYTIVVTILTESTIPEEFELDTLWRECMEGYYSGAWDMTGDEILEPNEMAQALMDQGSNPEFFGLTDDGLELK